MVRFIIRSGPINGCIIYTQNKVMLINTINANNFLDHASIISNNFSNNRLFYEYMTNYKGYII